MANSCAKRDPQDEYYCTRKKGHKGKHQAYYGYYDPDEIDEVNGSGAAWGELDMPKGGLIVEWDNEEE